MSSKDNTRPEHDLQDERVQGAPDDTAQDAGSGAPDAVDPEMAAPDAAETEPTDSDDQPDGTEQDIMQLEQELNTQLEAAQAQADDYLDSLQRERANFQNYKKRIERERGEQSQAVTAQLLLKLLPVLDDFYRAMDAVPARDDLQDDESSWLNGIDLILRRFERILSDHNVTEIEALGEPFDPNFHEAIGVDTDSDAESGTITEVLMRGYMHGDRVLRPAMVRVAD